MCKIKSSSKPRWFPCCRCSSDRSVNRRAGQATQQAGPVSITTRVLCMHHPSGATAPFSISSNHVKRGQQNGQKWLLCLIRRFSLSLVLLFFRVPMIIAPRRIFLHRKCKKNNIIFLYTLEEKIYNMIRFDFTFILYFTFPIIFFLFFLQVLFAHQSFIS